MLGLRGVLRCVWLRDGTQDVVSKIDGRHVYVFERVLNRFGAGDWGRALGGLGM